MLAYYTAVWAPDISVMTSLHKKMPLGGRPEPAQAHRAGPLIPLDALG